MGRIKEKKDSNILRAEDNQYRAKCGQRSSDILFEFGHITADKHYSKEALFNRGKQDKKILQKYFDLVVEISNNNWEVLGKRNKNNIGGFETIALSQFKECVINRCESKISQDTKLIVFRFGNGDNYRLVGYKSENCSRIIHVLGFDLDYSLYDHGS